MNQVCMVALASTHLLLLVSSSCCYTHRGHVQIGSVDFIYSQHDSPLPHWIYALAHTKKNWSCPEFSFMGTSLDQTPCPLPSILWQTICAIFWFLPSHFPIEYIHIFHYPSSRMKKYTQTCTYDLSSPQLLHRIRISHVVFWRKAGRTAGIFEMWVHVHECNQSSHMHSCIGTPLSQGVNGLVKESEPGVVRTELELMEHGLCGRS